MKGVAGSVLVLLPMALHTTLGWSFGESLLYLGVLVGLVLWIEGPSRTETGKGGSR